jgi:uncharacterized membrane protein
MSSLIIYTFIASIISGCGLISNSMPAIIGSMIVSPILQPLSKYLLNIKTYKNPILLTFLLVLIVILTGYIIGFLNNKIQYFNNETEAMRNITNFSNNEKNSKIITEFFIALSVGIGLPYAIINNDAALLVAFGIAPSITPPLVNCGLYLSNFLITKNIEDIHKSKRSFLLGSMHIIVILFIGLLYSLYIKKNKK